MLMGSQPEMFGDGLEIFFLIFFINFVRVFLAPYKTEAKIIARFLSKIALWLIRALKIWTPEPDNDLVERTVEHVKNMRQQFKKVKIKVG